MWKGIYDCLQNNLCGDAQKKIPVLCRAFKMMASWATMLEYLICYSIYLCTFTQVPLHCTVCLLKYLIFLTISGISFTSERNLYQLFCQYYIQSCYCLLHSVTHNMWWKLIRSLLPLTSVWIIKTRKLMGRLKKV